ncbi:MAG: sodium/proton antiporter NhaB [Gammaproteobacteria bacterium]|nr:sodium/proton antiporter NhaB [Gammaproteobacteria bacterium]
MAQSTGFRDSVWWGAYWTNFLGDAPRWYKWTIVGFLAANPFLYLLLGGYVAGWVLVLQFIFTLAMALKCYPLQPGGLLAIEALALGMTTPGHVYHEVEDNLKVILLLVFMVAGIFFMKELLLFTFTKLLVKVRSKLLLSFLFCLVAAILSAFLDALTVTAVVISVAVGFYSVYRRVAVAPAAIDRAVESEEDRDEELLNPEEMERFRAFLRNLVMHAAVGTALGGVTTIVGEPQNILIADKMGWEFMEFFIRMVPVTMPVLAVGLATCLLLERLKWFSYGAAIPLPVLEVLRNYDVEESAKRTRQDNARLVVQAIAAVFLVFALAFHVAEVGLVGLSIIVLQTAFNGIVEEHRIGHAFEEALPFTALLCVFFAIVAVISDQGLFQPVIEYVLELPARQQPGVFYIANGVLSMISDNVFVATVYIGEVETAFDAGVITRGQFDLLAVAINTGTNIPSVATPNGQAAFLFLLTSSLAPLIRLSYGRMVIMALPYTFTMGITGWVCVTWLL